MEALIPSAANPSNRPLDPETTMVEPSEPANPTDKASPAGPARHGGKRHRRRIKMRLPADEKPKRARGDSRRYWEIVMGLVFVIMCFAAMWIVMGALARPS